MLLPLEGIWFSKTRVRIATLCLDVALPETNRFLRWKTIYKPKRRVFEISVPKPRVPWEAFVYVKVPQFLLQRLEIDCHQPLWYSRRLHLAIAHKKHSFESRPYPGGTRELHREDQELSFEGSDPKTLFICCMLYAGHFTSQTKWSKKGA